MHPGGVRTNIARNARVSEGAERIQAGQSQFEKVLRMPPEQAAAIIVRGIQANRERILVGNDARLLDTLARLFPVRVGRILASRTS